MNTIKGLASNVWFAIFVVLPTMLAVVYYGLIAADIYTSEARFTVKSQGRQTPQVTTLASLIQTTGLSAGAEQTSEVISYIKSRSALQDLQRRVNVKASYAAAQADTLSRYPGLFRDDRFENLYEFYLGKVDAHVDNETGLAILVVHAFRPDDAQRINQQLLDFSEGLVNRLNEKARDNAIAEAQKRVTLAEQRVTQARVSLGAFRNDQSLLDPAKQASGVLEVANRLVAEQASLQSQLNDMLRIAPRNPSIPALQGRITAIGREIAAQNGRAVGTSTGIASKLGSYEKLSAEQEFAAQTLTAANASLEQARADSQRQQFYLERVVAPNLPDLPLLPHRLRAILTVAAVALCLYTVGWMLVIGILEHKPED